MSNAGRKILQVQDMQQDACFTTLSIVQQLLGMPCLGNVGRSEKVQFVQAMTMGDAVHERILMLCHERNLTVNKFSTICGVTQSTINNIVSGRNNATVSTLKKLCDGLEITIQEFFDSPLFENLEQEIR